ncbi:MAG: hypothetical protein WDA09_06040 [Bacteriovoracaceae bacterium]
MKLVFAIALLIVALPLWRFIDMVAWFEIDKSYSIIALMIWSFLFLIVPISLVFKRFLVPALILNFCFAVLVYFFVPNFSSASLDSPESRHCSLLNYSGFFYPFKALMPQAHEDDLLIRNQICWARKISKSIPDGLNKHEAQVYLNLVEEKLLLPEIKWKSTLPFFIPIYLQFNETDIPSLKAQKFWNDHYTAEIQERDYNFLSYPHSDYIKWEYGLVEKYWAKFIDGLEIEEIRIEPVEIKFQVKDREGP